MWLTNRVLSTKLGGVNITGDVETATLNVSGVSTFVDINVLDTIEINHENTAFEVISIIHKTFK